MKKMLVPLLFVMLVGCAKSAPSIPDHDPRLYTGSSRIVPVCQRFSTTFQCTWIELAPRHESKASEAVHVVTKVDGIAL